MSDVDSRFDITDDRSTHNQPHALGAPLWWVEHTADRFANEHAAEDQAYLRRCMWALFQQGALPAACLLVGAVAVDLNSLGLKDELSIYETAIN